jgi:hypothetical protein
MFMATIADLPFLLPSAPMGASRETNSLFAAATNFHKIAELPALGGYFWRHELSGRGMISR